MNTSWIFPVLLLIWDLKVSAEMSLAAHGQDTQPLRDNTVDDDDDFGSESGSGCGGDGKCLRPDLQPTVRAESPGAVEGKQVPKDVTEVPDGRIKGVSTSCTPQMEDPPPKSIFQKREVLADWRSQNQPHLEAC
ncbi:uncharacterized protein LOC114790948 isoform X2 [Denticeps clupeoides]|uniref:uncharacterized protein LOC114790948 isoform X2 n=1 Tax=Denticeps clupeoides TaxID=299321 RepID=UPI0010A49EB8|nr:uncharacterized protein LOC114790948 isoform X2 [Denticeps clupeoides]